MTWQDISPEAVRRHVVAGLHSRLELAHEFGVLANSPHLHDAIEDLVARGEIADRGGRLIVHDLLEPLTDLDDMED